MDRAPPATPLPVTKVHRLSITLPFNLYVYIIDDRWIRTATSGTKKAAFHGDAPANEGEVPDISSSARFQRFRIPSNDVVRVLTIMGRVLRTARVARRFRQDTHRQIVVLRAEVSR